MTRVVGRGAFEYLDQYWEILPGLSRALQWKLVPSAFTVVAGLPAGVPPERVESPRIGGVGGVNSGLAWGTRAVTDRAAGRTLVVAVPLSSATDTDLGNRPDDVDLLLHGREVYWVVREPATHASAVEWALHDTLSLIAVALLTSAPVPEAEVDDAGLQRIVAEAPVVAVSAYDGEGFLLFERIAG